jgi:hypothetical protein
LPRVADVLAIPEAAAWARTRSVDDAVPNDDRASPDDDRILPVPRERDEPS